MDQSFPTQRVLEIFNKISEIPRGSGNEKEIGQWLYQWAKDHDLKSEIDKIGNVRIEVPGKDNKNPDKTSYVLQGHMDMVCQKSEESDHNFETDPIIPIVEGDILKSDGTTTLGADNGIALALALTFAEDKNLHKQPFEILVTIDEERGCVGALNIQPDFLKGRKLINLDSEEEGYFTIGCAGSQDCTITKEFITTELSPDKQLLQISVKGGKSGHSGVEIQNKIANAIIVIARILTNIAAASPTQLISWSGGKIRNAIPGDSTAIIAIPAKDIEKIKNTIEGFKTVILNEYANVEPYLKITYEIVNDQTKSALTTTDTKSVINAIIAIPHGVLGMSNEIPELVETSNNLAIIELNTGKLAIKMMHRSSVTSRLIEVKQKLEAIASLLDAQFEASTGTSPWQPDPNSHLLSEVKNRYKTLFGKDPIIEAIHAGLECGIIGAIYPGMEMVSIGPSIDNAHTTKEQLHISTIEKVGVLLRELMK